MSDDQRIPEGKDIGGNQSVSSGAPRAPQPPIESTRLHGQDEAAGEDPADLLPSGPGPGSAV